ncbi:MAG: AraC family transcriptional regulator [Chlamydiales bacterium]|nr:AraC family transcriptional regulator [Chlamydiales bacterium]
MDSHHVKQILKVLIYLEDHLDDHMTVEKLAKVACYSPFHFHRVFQAVVGETAYQYVKRLRLEKAASKLRYTRRPITEIALDTSFDTSSSFTKAFKQCMGSSPRNYRTLYQEVNAMTKKLNELSMISPDKMEKTPPLDLLFIRRFGDYVISSQNAWDAMFTFIAEKHLEKSKLRYFSISHDDPNITSEDRLRFDACIQAPAGIKPQGEVGHQSLKGGKYAIFIHHGPHSTLSETFDRIFIKWLPDSKDSFDETRPIFCEHFNLEYVDKDDSKLTTNIYIPIA